MIERRRQTRRRWLGTCAGVAGITALAGCSESDETSGNGDGTENSGNGRGSLGDDWPMYGVDLRNTAHHPNSTGPDGDKLTKRSLLDREGRGAYQSAIVDETLYVSGTSGRIKAFDLETEEVLWEAERSGPPTVYDGTVYGPTENRSVYGYDGDTGDRWKSDAVDSISGLGLLRPLPTDRGIIVASRESIWNFDPETGAYNEVLEISDPGRGTTNWPAIDDETLYIGHWSELHAVNLETSEIKWTFEPKDGGGLVDSNPAVADGLVYLASYDGKLHAIDADTGEEEWAVDTVANVEASPAVAEGIVYLGERDQVLAVDAASGDLEWQETDAVAGEPEDIVVADGVAYVTTRYGISAYDAASGDLEWEYVIPDESDVVFNTPPTISDGTIYVGSADETWYAIEDA
ncbi:PQQ-binding-like beta-propeller repeat protein [Haloterrigena alkaliphila]|uniref:PQQ-binding-like beta-propeller repeat protein n=1 Tax=Haloterrigena alkaliphila TaxID=2816475 RepID=A0A8A2VG71_9EURY|nr:PQQ-binding-like beta-propeller repeat protein [Haloterrigena alkaliphila]QSW99374.1 PQQ-binding-like beta-propeller repeat protein [Haloterrigena alkaliphila]